MAASGSNDRAALFTHRPALDGFRGLCVAAVLAFHGGFSWAVGGYLGVSAFFTLSGFLIATLLLREREVTGGIGLRSFWARRARRLLPAGLIGLGVAVAYSAVWADTTGGLRGDVLACLGYVANWRFVFSERSYADLFAYPSPVQHYWSLAVEEQFYLVFPLLVVACAAIATRHLRRAVLGVVVTLSVVSITVSLLLADAGAGTDRAYYGTDTRGVEILVGVAAAVSVLHLAARRRAPVAPRWVTAAGIAALVAMAWMWVGVEQSHDALHPWLLLAHAVAAALVINTCIRVGPVASVLSWSPLRWLGRVSYGVYVYHWPVFLALSPERTGLSLGPLFALRITITFLLAASSYRWIERPILTGAWPRPGRRVVAPALVSVAVLLVAAVAVPPDRRPLVDLDAAADALEATPPLIVDDEGPPLRIAVFGDSVAMLSGLGIQRWGQQTGEVWLATSSTPLGCPMIREGEYEGFGMQRPPPGCDWGEEWPKRLSEVGGAVDVAVVHMGTWDIVPRQLPGFSGIVQIGEPEFDVYLRAQFDEVNAMLLDEVPSVVWLTLPVPASFADRYDGTTAERVHRFNDLMIESAAHAEGLVQVVDMASWVAEVGLDDSRLRPDGVHFGQQSAVTAGAWLGPAILHARAHPDQEVIGPDDVSAVPVP